MQRQKGRIDFERLRRAVPISAALQRYGILATLKRSGTQLKGPCPIHDSDTKSKSFVVDLEKNAWHCFSPKCNRGGGMLDLVAEVERVKVPQAALLVARWFAITRANPKTTKRKGERR